MLPRDPDDLESTRSLGQSHKIGDGSLDFSVDTQPPHENESRPLIITVEAAEPLPAMIDHFRIERQIGVGTYGRVLLARDTLLDREVVLKIPRHKDFADQKTDNDFIDEARKAALLEHPGIVRIYHIGNSPLGAFIVQPYVAGGDLRQALKSKTFSVLETAHLIAQVADTVSYAHQQRIIHRDLKPANILLDQSGNPLVADFGLAIHESQQPQARGMITGTWHYMSPEQIRGESHRLDGRSDIWSIGVILYQMLVGRLPFIHSDHRELRDAICQTLPRPPRQLNTSIPVELERICLRCLSIKMRNRYNTASDLAAELLDWLASQKLPTLSDNSKPDGTTPIVPSRIPEPTSALPTIVPRGLAAFGEEDHEFFESLLPGPRSKDQIPEQIRYWISKIECNSAKPTFCVGLIYGPSGCGKSSFAQAGLLPRLSSRIRRIFIEATDSDTEARLSIALRNAFPALPPSFTLTQMLASVRQGNHLAEGEKLLIVIDHFEQWLNASDIIGQDALLAALRQCDGEHIQTIVLARADFWMRVSRFFQELEISLVEHENFHALDLFDTVHAKNVLASFGRAYGKLPADGSLSNEQERFLTEAVKRLTVDDRVICIHLVLLAETLNAKPWEADLLQRGGRLEHIGRDFLNQQLNSNASNPNFRFYQTHIREILRSLLPSTGTDIKARFRPQSELARSADLPEQSKQFATIIDILDKQLRIISAVDPDGIQNTSDSSVITAATLASRPRYYQLTHDFLVPSVRAWLEDMDRLSPAGRTRTRLRALATSYSQTRDKRFLPNFLETLQVLVYVKRRDCDLAMQAVYAKVLKRLLSQLTIGCVLTACALGLFYHVWSQELNRRADEWVRTWTSAQMSALPVALDTIQLNKRLIIDAIHRKLSVTNETKLIQRLHLGLGLLGESNEQSCDAIVNSIGPATLDDLVLIHKALQSNAKYAIESIQRSVSNQGEDDLIVKLSMVAFHLGDHQLLDDCLVFVPDKFRHLAAVHLIGQDKDTIADYLKRIENAENEQEQFAELVNALTLHDWSKEDPSLQVRYRETLKDLFESSSGAGLHFALQSALFKMGVSQKFTPPKDSRWFELDDGLSFAFIAGSGKKVSLPVEAMNEKGKSTKLKIEGASDYWLSTTEVSSKLFGEFASTREFLERWGKEWTPGNDDEPAVSVRPDQAMHFCNWLSKKDGREPYYRETQEGPPESLLDTASTPAYKREVGLARIWQVDKTSNGFRVPTNFELLYAICGESKSALPTDSLDKARAYAVEQYWFADSSQNEPKRLRACATKMPNVFGIFDTLGNVGELTIQPQDGNILFYQLHLPVTIESPIRDLLDPKMLSLGLWYGSDTMGFRVACDASP